ncbi:hypothetical protein [Sporolactobacillus laevolacticus]|uniref:hypothetical protein n=1 Tax=Sporolactobacillus laevolacticus TaxID=33018 RepID=UPI0025B3E66B|nr:hypothetical protein [Sporolactobacillus laevolacticus]MDN3953788.1 hypothetical protein [Sporolactobacillus laevolacticus]
MNIYDIGFSEYHGRNVIELHFSSSSDSVEYLGLFNYKFSHPGLGAEQTTDILVINITYDSNHFKKDLIRFYIEKVGTLM